MNQDSQKLADVGQHSRGISPENPVSQENKDSGKEEVSDIFFRSQLQKSLNLAQPVLSENVQRINLEKNQLSFDWMRRLAAACNEIPDPKAQKYFCSIRQCVNKATRSEPSLAKIRYTRLYKEPIILVLNKHELSVPEDEKELKSTESILKQLLPQKSKVQDEQGSYSGALKRKMISPTDPREHKAGKFISKEIGYPHDFICQKDGSNLSKTAETSQDYKSSTTPKKTSPTETNRILSTDPNIILPAEQKWISPTYPQMAISSELKKISPIDIQMQQPLGVHNWIPPIYFDPDVKFQYFEPARVINIPETTYVSSLYVNKNDAPFFQDYDRRAVCTKDAFGYTVEQPIPHQTSSAMPCHGDTIATNVMQNEQLADAETITANERLNIIYPMDMQMQQPIGVNEWIPPIYFDPDHKFQSLEPARVINIPETSYVSSLYVNKDDVPFFQDYDRCAGSRKDAFGYTVEQPIPHQTSSAMPYQRNTMATNAVQNEQLANASIIRVKDSLNPQNFPPNSECNVAMDSRAMSILSYGCDPQMTPQCFHDDSRHDRPHSYPSSEQMSITFADKMLNESSHNIIQRLQDINKFHLSDQQSSKYGTVIVGSEIRRIYADSERDKISYGRGVMAQNTTADVYQIQPSTPKPPSSVLKEIESGPDLAVLSDWTADDFLDCWGSSEQLNKYAAIAEISDAELDHITGTGLSLNEADIVDPPRGDSPLNCIIATMPNLETFGSSVVGTFQTSDNNLHVDAQTRNQQRPIQGRFEVTSESSKMLYKEPILNLALREARIQQAEPPLASTEMKTEYYSDDKLRVADYRTSMSRDASSQTEPLPVKGMADKCQQIPESSINFQTTAQLDVPMNLFSLFEDLNE